MFRSTLIKMTAIYLAIIMIISISFSTAIFATSASQIASNFRRGQNAIEKRVNDRPGPGGIFNDPDFLAEREQLLAEGRTSLLSQLTYINIAILILGGALSYFLARRTLKPIEESHEAQIRFTADASHELRSPLAAMKTEIEVALRDKELGIKDARELLKSNLEELDRLSGLSENLLELARENGLKKEVFDTKNAIETALAVVQKKPEAKGFEFTQKLEKNLTINADKSKVEEVLVILFDNALKYGGQKITITSKTEGHLAIISVSDEGIGIAEKDLPHIFDRFYRADQSRSKNKVQGYGLGLSIAKKIIDLHHGEIFAKSKPGQGSTLTIKLPR